ncbi:GDSL-type esterase/lipase family protein [Blastococcus sp. SYSU D01042]
MDRPLTRARAWPAVVAVSVLAVLAVVVTARSGAEPGTPRTRPAAEVPALVDGNGTVGPVVALGDSLTADARPRYWSWYVAALADEPRLLDAGNAGIPGDTTTGMLDRFERDVAVHEPRVVVILGGTNDLAVGRSAEDVLGTLEQLAGRVRELDAVPVLATVPPRTDGDLTEQVADLNAAIRAYGERSGTRVIDFSSVLADDDGDWLPGSTDDGVHPTEAAAAAMGRLAVRELFRD